MNRRDFLVTAMQVGALTSMAPATAIGEEAHSEWPEMSWWYQSPASRYWEGVPLSNGRLAAMVYGGVENELIPFNDESLWSGSPYDPNNPAGKAALPEIRSLLLDGHYVEAQKACEKLMSIPVSVQHYQPMGELRIKNVLPGPATDYRRELRMDSAIAHVEFLSGGVRFTRDVFASFPDQVLVVHMTADHPAMISMFIRLGSIQPSAHSRFAGERGIVMDGSAETVTHGASATPVIPAKMLWQAQLRVIAEGGTVAQERLEEDEERTSSCLSVKKANAVTIVLAGATNYAKWNSLDADAGARVNARIHAAGLPYHVLRGRHLADWQPQFHSCRLDLGGEGAATSDTTTRLDRLRQGADDPLFAAQYFQYGRYLLMAVSRPGTLPFNNHNVWLNNMEGRWQGRWTLNINIQECYWPAENTSLPQTNEALVAFTEQLAEAGARTAWRVAASATLGTLCISDGPRLSSAYLSFAERECGILPGLSHRRAETPLAGHCSFRVARELLLHARGSSHAGLHGPDARQRSFAGSVSTYDRSERSTRRGCGSPAKIKDSSSAVAT